MLPHLPNTFVILRAIHSIIDALRLAETCLLPPLELFLDFLQAL